MKKLLVAGLLTTNIREELEGLNLFLKKIPLLTAVPAEAFDCFFCTLSLVSLSLVSLSLVSDYVPLGTACCAPTNFGVEPSVPLQQTPLSRED